MKDIMFTVSIIGAGQLGSRHLQGARKCSKKIDIWVVDPSDESLRIAEERYNQINTPINHDIHFEKSIENIPFDIDLAIIATSSIPRYKILQNLLATHNVKYLILEKFLFPSLDEYELASNILFEKNVMTYVNCPRRMFSNYNYLENVIKSDSPITMIVEGTDWGLCCNAIHYIDIFMKLCGEYDYTVNTDKLIPDIRESKRKGYIEFNGTLKISTKKGDELILTSSEVNHPKEFLLSIRSGNNHYEVNESTGTLTHGVETLSFQTPYQSELSGIWIDSLIKGEKLSLPEYEESKRYHKIFLSKMLEFYNDLTKENTTILPIT